MQKVSPITTIFKSAVHTRNEDNPSSEDEKELNVQLPEENSLLSEEEDYEVQTYKYKLPPLEAIAAATFLEEAADELAILGRIGNLPDVQNNVAFKSLAERLNTALGDVQVFDPETIEPYEIALDKQKFIKFQTDRSYLENIIRETIKELKNSGSYRYLIDQLNQHEQIFYEENQLLDKEMKNRNRLNDLQNLLERERRETLQKIQGCSEIIGNLKDEFQDILRENKVKTTYIESWENSRMEQNSFTLDKQEEAYLNIINDAKLEIEKETRIDAEIENFISETQKQYEEDIQMWMESYDKEVEVRDTEIQVLKEKREEQFTRLREISALYEQHKQEIEQYLAVKEQRRLAEEFVANQHKAATRIQAWWRGVMVRKGFGPFRKKKGKKDSGKKKGKK